MDALAAPLTNSFLPVPLPATTSATRQAMTVPAWWSWTGVGRSTRRNKSLRGRGTMTEVGNLPRHLNSNSSPLGQHRFELRVVDQQGAWTTDAVVISHC